MSSSRSFKRRRYTATRGTRKKRYVAPSRSSRPQYMFVNPENKFLDQETLDDAFGTNWATMEPATLAISAVGQDDTESTRDGRVYHINSVHVQGRFHRAVEESNANAGQDLIARIVVVLDTQTNGAQLTATDVMDGSLTDDWDGFHNLQQTKRFKVLFDRKVIIPIIQTNEGAANLFAVSDSSVLFKMNHTFKTPIKVICKGTAATIASVTDNSIHVIGVANAASALLSYQSRIRFTG